MSTLNLLAGVYFEESSDEGLMAVKKLLQNNENAQLTVYARNSREQLNKKAFMQAATVQHG